MSLDSASILPSKSVVELDLDTLKLINLGDEIIKQVKEEILIDGAGNQIFDVRKSNGYSAYRSMVVRQIKETLHECCTNMDVALNPQNSTNESADIPKNKFHAKCVCNNTTDAKHEVNVKYPRRLAFGALFKKGGNCQEFAAISYILLRAKANESLAGVKVAFCFLPAKNNDRTTENKSDFDAAVHFCVAIGKWDLLNSTKDIIDEKWMIRKEILDRWGDTVVIVDPWPSNARAVLWKDYFCHDRNVEIKKIAALDKKSEVYTDYITGEGEALLLAIYDAYKQKYGLDWKKLKEKVLKHSTKDCIDDYIRQSIQGNNMFFKLTSTHNNINPAYIAKTKSLDRNVLKDIESKFKSSFAV